MSRSRRKTPICGFYGVFESDRNFKRIWHRRMRAMNRARLHSCNPDTVLLPLDDEAGNLWCSSKETKKWFAAREYPERMRK